MNVCDDVKTLVGASEKLLEYVNASEGVNSLDGVKLFE